MRKNRPRPRPKSLKPGLRYEKIVADIHRQFAGNAVVTENETIIGKSGRKRQIDVALRTDVAGYQVLVVVECKDYQRRVGIGKVDELIGKIDDVGAAKGILVSDSGFDSGAVDRAKSDSRIELASVIDTTNGALRSRIGLPVSITFHTHKVSTVSIKTDFLPTHPSWSLNLSDEQRNTVQNKEQVEDTKANILNLVTAFFFLV